MNVQVDPNIFLTYRARDIQTSMRSRPFCLDILADPHTALENFDKLDFDQAPVTSNNVIIGWILRKELWSSNSIESSFKKLSQKDLISADAPLNDALVRLNDQELIFLVGSSGIDGFVVRSDIGRHVSRAHLYLLISGLEIVLSRIVARDITNSSDLINFMKPSSRDAWERDKRMGFDANPIEYLDLRALGDAFATIKRGMNHAGISVANWNKFILDLTDIRNWVAHSNTEQITKHPFSDIVNKMQMTEKIIGSLVTY